MVREMDSARIGLQSSGIGMNKATKETWNSEKDKVGIAWVRSRET